MKHESRWFQLKELPACACGRTLCKKGMLRELQSNKNNRPGPSAGLIRSSVATIRIDCYACKRSWDVRFLSVDRYERGTARAAPTDCWPLRPGESPEAALAHILDNRRREAAGEKPVSRQGPELVPAMTQEDAQRARRYIAAARARFGWDG